MLTACTLTGVDTHTDLDRVFDLSRRYPFAEWGVLYSPGRAGRAGMWRYPDIAWFERMLLPRLAANPGGPRFALHLCGGAVGEFLNGEGAAARIAADFPRIQINLRNGRDQSPLLCEALRRHPDQTLITQHNLGNLLLHRDLSGFPNYAVLFDSSGGRGILRRRWSAPLMQESRILACGYAGGLGPENLATELPRIRDAAQGQPFWIDMESRLRDDHDRFDLDRAGRCLEIAAPFALRAADEPARDSSLSTPGTSP